MNIYRSLIYLLAFCSGFSIMSIELIGGRILAPYFGSSIYVWGSIITVFMLSLSIGYLLGGKWSLHNPHIRKYGALYLAAAITALPVIFFSNSIMDSIFMKIEDPRYGSLLASMILFFIPTIILGMISPYSVRLLVQHHQQSGQIAGLLYFVSTLGSALGTIITSFYLVLWFEVNEILYSLVSILLMGGIFAICYPTYGKNHENQ